MISDSVAAEVGKLPHNLSPWNMFLAADVVVQLVMLGLAFASLVTWTIWLAKLIELRASSRSVQSALDRLRSAPSLAEKLASPSPSKVLAPSFFGATL